MKAGATFAATLLFPCGNVRPAIEAIIAKTKPTQHGIRSLVKEVVASELFKTE